MIVTITLNPSMDRTLLVESFEKGAVCKAEMVLAAPGGKGINVSRAVKRLGGATLALAILGGRTGRTIAEELDGEGIPFRQVSVPGESRTCYGLIDRLCLTETIINETGPLVSLETIDEFNTLYSRSIEAADVVALSGSVPKGISSPDIYGELVKKGKEKKAMVLVDTTGPQLTAALDALPYMVKINKTEMERLTGKPLEKEAALIHAMGQVQERGIPCVAITQGGGPLLALTPEGLLSIMPAAVNPLNAWGCGDCVTAGIAIGLAQGRPLPDCFRYGVAAGTANTLSYGAGFINREETSRFYERTRHRTPGNI